MSNLIYAVAEAQSADRTRELEGHRHGIVSSRRRSRGLLSRLRRRYLADEHASQLGTLHRA